MMTRKHFKAIAGVLRFARPYTLGCSDKYQQWKFMVEEMAAMCYGENPRFDRAKFLDACGYNGE